MDLETPAPLAKPLRTYRTHDGFYLRLGLGVGSLSLDVKPKDNTVKSRNASGDAVGLDVLVGGTPVRGLAVGGIFSVSRAEASKLDVGGQATNDNVTFTAVILGGFVDGFPDPHGGFHIGGTLGLASTSLVTDSNTDTDFTGGGVGLGGWVGYALWLGPEWSLGGVLRGSAAVTSDSAGDFTGRGAAIALEVTALYN